MHIPTAREACDRGVELPVGVKLTELRDHADERGVFRELFRSSWARGDQPVQWNLVSSKANVLRGVHAHFSHVDYLTMGAGEMVLGLHDFRAGPVTARRSAMLRLQADDPHLVEIPAGVGHGFYFPADATHIYGVSRLFDGPEADACRWDDPALDLEWPCEDPILSERDRAAGSHRALAQRFHALTLA